ncbi:MAG TPA: alpha/beta hydrolase [Aliidiomarina sp.]|nr:alpha/beta hydrolase [Aliidiomarina sp.]
MDTIPWQGWQWQAPEGFWLRGTHTQPRGLPVLHFIHGNSYCGRIYEPMWKALYPHFDIFLHDVQGHGDSDLGGKFVGWKRCAELVIAVWENYRGMWGNVPQIGMGHSFGGVLTSVIAATNAHFFERLVLLDPILMPPRYLRWVEPLQNLGLYKLNPYSGRARKRRAQWPDKESALVGLTGRGMFKGWSDDAMHAYVDYGMNSTEQGVQLKCAPSREAEIFGSYMPRLWKTLARLETPTDIMYGSETYPFLQETMAKLEALPTVHIEIVPGGHCFMQEHPEATAERIIKLLA